MQDRDDKQIEPKKFRVYYYDLKTRRGIITVFISVPFALKTDVTQSFRQLTGNRLLQSIQTPFSADSRRCCVTSVKEYVAYAIQEFFKPNVEQDGIPYQIAEQIAWQAYSALASQSLFVAALCDAVLMCLHPTEIFFAALQRMQEEPFIPTTVESVYEFVNIHFFIKTRRRL